MLESRQVNQNRSETNGLAEREVCRVKEGTSALLVQSGLAEKWWREARECFCFLRNMQDKPVDRKSPSERRFGTSFDGPILPFGAHICVSPISTKDKSRLHHAGTKKCFQECSSDTDQSGLARQRELTTSRQKFTSKDSSPKKLGI